MTITHKGHPLFLWTNSSLTLGCPAGLSSSLMCSPRPPGQQLHHARLGQSSPAPRPAASRWRSATAPRPATPPQRCPDQQHLRHCAPASSTSATVPRPAAPPPLRPGQQQTSPGGEKYSGLASNLAQLGGIW